MVLASAGFAASREGERKHRKAEVAKRRALKIFMGSFGLSGVRKAEMDYMGFDRGGPSVRKARPFNWGLN
jgi:hypothetical protein